MQNLSKLFAFRAPREEYSVETEYLTVPQVAERYGVHHVTVRRWLRAGVIRGVRMGEHGNWRVIVASTAEAEGRDEPRSAE